jgi:hypothetical protein
MTSQFKPPYYDRNIDYSLVGYLTHDLQTIMALFIFKTPELGVKLDAVPVADRQDYFFHRFVTFAETYVNLSTDDSIYFGSTSKDKAGSTQIAGGDGRSRSGAKYLKDKYREQRDTHQSRIAYFERKFQCCISGEKDERTFVGYSHLWNKIGVETIRQSILANYQSQIASAYDDITLQTPIPDKLNRYFVPLTIRNKVYQQWRNRIRNTVSTDTNKKLVEKEEDIQTQTSKVASDAISLAMEEINAMVADEEW